MIDPAQADTRPIASMQSMAHGRTEQKARSYSSSILLRSPRRATVQISMAVTPAAGYVFYFRDITIESEVDRMKSEFLSTAAHELRTPLASIFGFTELMINRNMPAAKQRELLLTIHRQSHLLINLINELLDLSRIEARQGKDFHREHVMVERLIELTLNGLMVEGDGRQVRVQMEHGRDAIMVDTEKTMQALTNVLTNAFKYSPNGGEIVLTTLFDQSNGYGEVGIRVSDRGLGMSPEQVSRVFERFYRSDPSGPIRGTGLGMSLVKEIVELQDGHVQIQSELGVGTAVTLWFPIASTNLLSTPAPLENQR
jgi:signal transduction histidine kinase